VITGESSGTVERYRAVKVTMEGAYLKKRRLTARPARVVAVPMGCLAY
jgi:hypothetical protein